MLTLPLRTKFYKSEWSVRRIPLTLCRDFIKQYHYAKSSSSWGVYSFGLFLKGDMNLWGVTQWIAPPKFIVDKYNPGNFSTSLVLSRMAIHPIIPTNAASYMLSQCVKYIQDDNRFDWLVTYADTWRGHTGIVYKAANWHYQGLSLASRVWVNSDGDLISTYRNGKTVNSDSMRHEGNSCLGYYSKHIFTLQLKTIKPLRQMKLAI